MKISIVTVCYNSSDFIRTAIESVLNQTYKNIEYIVVDGKSKDNTLDIVKGYEPAFEGRMRWVSEPDRGLYDAMNKGILMATGDVVGIINSDDLFADNLAIEKVMKVFEQNPDLDSVCADLYYVSQGDTNKIVRHWKTRPYKHGAFRRGWHPAHPTFYVKKHVYEKHGLFNLDFRLAADFELMLRFLERCRISTTYLPEPLVKMRLGGTTNKNLKNIVNQNKECVRAFDVNGLKVNGFLYLFYRLVPKLLQFFK